MYHYSVIIQYDKTDEVYVAKVPELEGCMAHGGTYEEATKEIKIALEGWLETAKEMGIAIPEPMVLAS
ncbi:MAG: type II toxin-antitoxin system HicB family antitoxin [Defluviitaleaceae bacterium]|nr:type II toxin-antitoxin system HicB family antitoxin [Defluviitaleaceae bacterium]